MNVCFTRHAWARVHERLSMTASEVANILDAGITINIGVEEESNRIHELFYSECDKECFVALVDRVSHVVVTILPTDYHEIISWKVSLDAQLKARALTAGDRTDDVFDVTKAAAILPLPGGGGRSHHNCK